MNLCTKVQISEGGGMDRISNIEYRISKNESETIIRIILPSGPLLQEPYNIRSDRIRREWQLQYPLP